MTGRAYIGELLTQVWLIFDKEVNAQKESLKKTCKLPYAHEKVCDENERNKQTKKQEKNDARV